MTISNNATGIRPGVCTSTTRPTNPYEGFVIYETDTDLSYVWGGAAWQQVSGGTAVGNSGLVYVKSQTIGSAVSSVTVSSAFSADYDSYQILVSGGTSSGNFTTRLTLGATATGYYYAGAYCTYAGVVSASTGANVASWLTTSNNTDANMLNVFLSQPFLAKPTAFSTNYYGVSTGDGAFAIQGYLNNSTSYTAFTLTTTGGTLTGGTIHVYGYRK
jgi:hypothetical protein